MLSFELGYKYFQLGYKYTTHQQYRNWEAICVWVKNH